MSSRKISLGILFGGQSAEHEVSLQSVANILQALDTEKYTPVLIGVDRQGRWHIVSDLASGIDPDAPNVTLIPGGNGVLLFEDEAFPEFKLDVVFPVLHGPKGEDGSVQGLLELANVPYVGSNILGSAVSMDKDFMKRLCRQAGIAVADSCTIYAHQQDRLSTKEICESLGLPLFVKPANMGSSVGVSRVDAVEALDTAIERSFRFDTKVLIESAVKGDEIECAVLGNDTPEVASTVGRIIPAGDTFYTYEAKYIDESGAILEIPARIPKAVAERARHTALQVFQLLDCCGLSRVDMFARADGSIVVNEINTLPGFTLNSMYPKLWELSGLAYTDLISRLIELALERHAKRQHLQTHL